MLKTSTLFPMLSNAEYSSPLKGGPLSVLTVVGTPCVANILSSFGITMEAFVDFTICTSGKREYLSITTNR